MTGPSPVGRKGRYGRGFLSQPRGQCHQRLAGFVRFSPKQHVAGALQSDAGFEGDEPATLNVIGSEQCRDNQESLASQCCFVGCIEMREASPRTTGIGTITCSQPSIQLAGSRAALEKRNVCCALVIADAVQPRRTDMG